MVPAELPAGSALDAVDLDDGYVVVLCGSFEKLREDASDTFLQSTSVRDSLRRITWLLLSRPTGATSRDQRTEFSAYVAPATYTLHRGDWAATAGGSSALTNVVDEILNYGRAR